MTTVLLPNMEALVGKWLREDPSIAALGANVAGTTPRKTTTPWIRITLIDEPTDPQSGLDHFVAHYLQLDCFAGKTATDDFSGQMEARTLYSTARAVLMGLRGRATDGVVVTGVSCSGGRSPDTSMEPARERYILNATVRAHGGV